MHSQLLKIFSRTTGILIIAVLRLGNGLTVSDVASCFRYSLKCMHGNQYEIMQFANFTCVHCWDLSLVSFPIQIKKHSLTGWSFMKMSRGKSELPEGATWEADSDVPLPLHLCVCVYMYCYVCLVLVQVGHLCRFSFLCLFKLVISVDFLFYALGPSGYWLTDRLLGYLFFF